MELDSFLRTKLENFEPFSILHTTRQPKCIQTLVVSAIKTTTIQRQQRHGHSTEMASSTSLKTHSMIPFFVAFLLVFASSVSPVLSLPAPVSDSGNRLLANQTFRPSKEVLRLKRANAYLKKINKPAVKTIQVLLSSGFSVFLSLERQLSFSWFCVLSFLLIWFLVFCALEP